MTSSRPWRYLFAIALDKSECVAANPKMQNYTVTPELTYCSMQLTCARCHLPFWFTANEQRQWYEQWGFWIDSIPKECVDCRKELRRLLSLRQEYDRDIVKAIRSKDFGIKTRAAEIIDQLLLAGVKLQTKVITTRNVLAKQIARIANTNQSTDPSA